MLEQKNIGTDWYETVVYKNNCIQFRTHHRSLDDAVRSIAGNEQNGREIVIYKLQPIYWTGKEENQ